MVAIDVSPELTAALREASDAATRLLQALKLPDQEQCRRATQDFLAAGRQQREAWLAMATPLPTPE